MSEKPLEKEQTEEILNEQEDQAEEMPKAEETSSEPHSESETTDSVDGSEEESAEDTSSDPSNLLDKVEQLESELQESSNRYLRLQADYDNFRRRTREEKIQEKKLRAQDLVQDLLPVLDNFKRALEIDVTNEEAKSLKQGMEMVYRNLQEAMKKEGVEEIESLNQPFDPNLHQAVMQDAVEGVEPNIVVDVFQAGYSLNGRVIRPAMVKVSS